MIEWTYLFLVGVSIQKVGANPCVIRSNKYKSNITTDTKKRLVKPHFVKVALVGHSAVGHSEVCEQALFQVAKGQS